jgi:hypothetical protein
MCTNSWKSNLRWVSQSLFHKCRTELLKQHMLAGELYAGYCKVKMWKLVSQWHFQLSTTSDQKSALKVSPITSMRLFWEEKFIIFTSLRNSNQLCRQSTAKCVNPLVIKEVYPQWAWCWEKWGLGKFNSPNRCALWILALCKDFLCILNLSYMLPLNIHASILVHFILQVEEDFW